MQLLVDATQLGVIILAGGRSTRMGADKAAVRVNGTRLVDALLAALPEASPRVVVSPFDLGLPTVSEEPPFGGPVAGIAAGCAALETELIAVLAVDAPGSAALLPALVAAVAGGADAAAVEAADGHVEPLCAVWRREVLEAQMDRVGARDVAAKALLGGVDKLALVPGTGAERDYDSPAELAALGEVEL